MRGGVPALEGDLGKGKAVIARTPEGSVAIP